MCGMPARSRTTRTGAARPNRSIVPDSCGISGGGGASAGRHAASADTHASAHRKRAFTISNQELCFTLRVMSIKDGLLADFDHEMGTTRRLLERLPDDRLSWKPHPRSMTLGGLATHLSSIPQWGGTILNDPAFDLAGAP